MIRCYRVDKKEELADLFSLRYSVFCVERGFLKAEDYPDGLEKDEFDAHSIQFAVRDAQGRLAGTARLVRDSPLGLPLERYFKIDDAIRGIDRSRLTEFSRFAVSMKHGGPRADADPQTASWQTDIALGLVKVAYEEIRRQGITHICAAIERPLWRMLRHGGFALRQIAAPGEYHGLRIPCLAAIAEMEEFLSFWKRQGMRRSP